MDTRILTDLFQKTDELLWNSYHCSNARKFETLKSSLVFPRSGVNLRVSEQEARFMFASVVSDSGFLYSIETPTEERYTQKGLKGSRAFVDMSLRDRTGKIVYNIEFKSGIISSQLNEIQIKNYDKEIRKKLFPYIKDFEKLLTEAKPGVWFHILKSVRNKSLIYLVESLNNVIKIVKNTQKINNTKLTIHICVLRQQFSITCDVDLSNSVIPKVKYRVSIPELLNYSEVEWDFHSVNKHNNEEPIL